MVRYIGQTAGPARVRFKGHCAAARNKKGNAHLGSWIRNLIECGQEPLLLILEASAIDGNAAEICWIAKYTEQGAVLFNKTKGGQGWNAGNKASESTRLKIAAAGRGKRHSEEAKAKIGSANRGRKRPDLAARNAKNALLSDQEVRQIRLLRIQGYNAYQIGRMFNISNIAASSIGRHLSYQRVV